MVTAVMLCFVLAVALLFTKLLIHRDRPVRCPGCGEHRLLTEPSQRTSDADPTTGRWRSVEAYSCDACGAEFRQVEGASLLPRARWDAGVRDAAGVPGARVIRR